MSAVDHDKVRRWTAKFTHADAQLLAGVLDFVGTEAGFKSELLARLRRADDYHRALDIIKIVRRLSEPEIIWLRDNPQTIRSFRR